MKTALITGFGMDSKTLTHILLSKGYSVFIGTRRNTTLELSTINNFFTNDLINYPNSKLSTLFLDVSDSCSVRNGLEKVIQEAGVIDEIYHLAASSLVSYSYETPLLNIQTNGLSVLHFLDNIRQISPQTRFYYAASTEMFSGLAGDQKYDENSKFYPKTPYGCSKVLGFDLTRYFRETYGLFAVSGILANHSNFYRHPSFFIRKMTQTVAQIALGREKELRIGHLEWARDEFFSDFGMEAAWKLLQLDLAQDTIIGNGQCHWGEEYVDICFNYFNLKWQDHIVFDAKFLRKNEVVKLEVNPALAMRTIGWNPNRMSFKKHIELICEWDLAVQQGQKPIREDILLKYPQTILT